MSSLISTLVSGKEKGRWYERAAIPSWFEPNPVASRAVYTDIPYAGFVRVENSMLVSPTVRRTAIGRAYPTSNKNHLKVIFGAHGIILRDFVWVYIYVTMVLVTLVAGASAFEAWTAMFYWFSVLFVPFAFQIAWTFMSEHASTKILYDYSKQTNASGFVFANVHDMCSYALYFRVVSEAAFWTFTAIWRQAAWNVGSYYNLPAAPQLAPQSGTADQSWMAACLALSIIALVVSVVGIVQFLVTHCRRMIRLSNSRR